MAHDFIASELLSTRLIAISLVLTEANLLMAMIELRTGSI